MDPNEREHYEALIQSPGWLLLTAWAKDEFRQQLSTLVALAVKDSNDAAALTKLRQVVAAKEAVELVLEYPAKRAKELRAEAEARLRPALPGRRGSL